MAAGSSLRRELRDLALGLGLTDLRVSTAERFAPTEADLRKRKAAGQLADLQFTARRPEVSCDPNRTVPGARSVVSVALPYLVDPSEAGHLPAGAADRSAPAGRLPRYAWRDFYAELRVKLRRLAGLIERSSRSGRSEVFVDRNELVDRAAAVRSGAGWYGKSTNVLTPQAGSWVVLGELVTEAELEPDPPLRTNCGTCDLCIRACPTQAIVEPGVLDASRCLTYWGQSHHPIPESFRAPMQDMVYGCDICQETCPVNLRFEPAAAQDPDRTLSYLPLDTLFEGPKSRVMEDLRRLFVPRNRIAYLRRNAAVVAGNLGEAGSSIALAAASDGNPLVRRHGAWALGRADGRSARLQLERMRANDPSPAVRVEARAALEAAS